MGKNEGKKIVNIKQENKSTDMANKGNIPLANKGNIPLVNRESSFTSEIIKKGYNKDRAKKK